MAKYKVTTVDDKEYLIEADYYTCESGFRLEFFRTSRSSSTAAISASSTEKVASFDKWIGVVNVDALAGAELGDSSAEQDKRNLMREYHQLLEISVQDLSKIKSLEKENQELKEKLNILNILRDTFN